MIEAIKEILKALLGLGNGASTINKVGGLVTNLTLLPVVMWLWANADKEVHFNTSLGFLALMCSFAYVVLEVLRRSRASTGGS